MRLIDFQALAMRFRLAAYGLGVAGEAGECADIIKKHIGQGHPLDVEKLKLEIQAKQLLKEQGRRDAFMRAVREASKGLFDKQRAVYDSKAKRICMRAGRRSGKTSTALPVALRAAARFPGSIIPVCERTLTCAAAMAFWKALQAFDAEWKLGIEFRHTIKEALLPNGSRVYRCTCPAGRIDPDCFSEVHDI